MTALTAAEFYARLADRTLLDPEQAPIVVGEVLHALSHSLPEAERRALAAELPPSFGAALLDGRVEYDPYVDEHLFLGYLMTEHQTTGHWDRTAGGDDILAGSAAEEITLRAQAVLGLVGEGVSPASRERICAAAPKVIAGWLRGET